MISFSLSPSPSLSEVKTTEHRQEKTATHPYDEVFFSPEFAEGSQSCMGADCPYFPSHRHEGQPSDTSEHFVAQNDSTVKPFPSIPCPHTTLKPPRGAQYFYYYFLTEVRPPVDGGMK